MADFGFNEAYRTDEFVVEIEGIESPGITKVDGLSEGEIDPVDQPDGGANITHKISSGIVKYDDLTLERNMDGSSADAAFKAWFEEMFKIDGTGAGSAMRKNSSARRCCALRLKAPGSNRPNSRRWMRPVPI
jgi:phage tail-like protein